MMLLNISLFYRCRYSTVSQSAFCSEIRFNDTKQKKSLFHSNDTELVFFFALPFSQSQSSITEISNDFVCLCLGLTSQFSHVGKKATASWVLPVLSGSKVSCSMTQHGGGGFRIPDPRFGVRRSTTEPPRSPVSIEYSHHDYHKISKVYLELKTRAIGWSAEECASIALCLQGYTENRPAGCLQPVILNTPIPIAWDWLTVRLTN